MTMIQLWWLSLAIFAVVVVVVALLLGLIIAAAKSIDEHAAAIWTVGKKIAGNTVSIWMLQETNEELNGINNTVQTIHDVAASIDNRLRGLADILGKRS
jgi:hypothetical protein